MANGRVAQRQTVRTTRTATTVWIGPTAARGELLVECAALFRRRVVAAFADALHVAVRPARGVLRGQHPEDLLAGAHSSSLAVAIGISRALRHNVEMDIDRKLDRSTRHVVDTGM